MKSNWTTRKWAGLLLVAGAAQFLLSLVVAEAIYPNYSVSANFISDLGVGPVAGLFNGSVMVLGLTVLGAAYYLWKEFKEAVFTGALGLAGLGALGVGLFPEGSALHVPASFVTFFFGAGAALLVFRLRLGKMEAMLSVLMGAASLLALFLFAWRLTLGLGVGGMERMIAYPILIWAIGLGGYLLNSQEG